MSRSSSGGRSGELAESHREHRCAQRVLERLPRTEVGCERECADELRGADGLLHARSYAAFRQPLR